MAGIAASEGAYRAIRTAIVRGRYRPGDILSRPALAAEFSVSQTPLREALSRLAVEGFVEVLPRSGTRVRPIDVLSLHEGQFLAVALAVEAVRRLAGRPATAEALDGLDEMHFLPEVFRGVGMERLWASVVPYFGALERCRALDPVTTAATSGLVRDVANRIAAADAPGAVAAMRALLADDLAPLADWRERHPDMFA